MQPLWGTVRLWWQRIHRHYRVRCVECTELTGLPRYLTMTSHKSQFFIAVLGHLGLWQTCLLRMLPWCEEHFWAQRRRLFGLCCRSDQNDNAYRHTVSKQTKGNYFGLTSIYATHKLTLSDEVIVSEELRTAGDGRAASDVGLHGQICAALIATAGANLFYLMMASLVRARAVKTTRSSSLIISKVFTKRGSNNYSLLFQRSNRLLSPDREPSHRHVSPACRWRHIRRRSLDSSKKAATAFSV